jgi:hypothetical protein
VADTVLQEIFPPGEGVVLVPDATGQAIAEAAIPVLRDRDLATDLGRRARARAREHFREEHFGARLRSALAPLLAMKESALGLAD